ncbi:ABC transporter ATP-binding protein, partial [Clostridiaceae bacterium HSG29]|nr:ABC transporter ATP-binding protein [Clostridiaceae bacterium HSG29]
KTLRRISIKKFTEMVYNNHFSKNYLELEKRKKSFETKIELALKKSNFVEAKAFVGKLGRVIKELKRVN